MSLLLLLLGGGAAPTVVTPAGLEAASNLGSPAISVTTATSGLAGTSALGTAGVSVTTQANGITATATLGTPTATVATVVAPSGLAASALQGTAAVSSSLGASGLAGAVSLGTVGISNRVTPTGVTATASAGAISQVPGALAVSGFGRTAGLGTPTVKVTVIGSGVPTTERWVSPRLPGSDPIVSVLQQSLDRLARVQGRAPVVMPDRRVTTGMTVTDADGVVLVDASAGAVTVTLPSASAAIRGRSWTIKKMDSSANNVVIAAASGDLIDGSATYSFNTQYKTVWVQCALTTPPSTYNWVLV